MWMGNIQWINIIICVLIPFRLIIFTKHTENFKIIR
jgi:hypothetical protein